jgi:hypothetical protein
MKSAGFFSKRWQALIRLSFRDPEDYVLKPRQLQTLNTVLWNSTPCTFQKPVRKNFKCYCIIMMKFKKNDASKFLRNRDLCKLHFTSTTSPKVGGSIPDVIWIFHWRIPSGRNMVLGSTQPLTEMCTSNNSWGVKVGGAYGWQPYHLLVPTVLKSGSRNFLEPSWSLQVCLGISVPFVFQNNTPHYWHSSTVLRYFLLSWQSALINYTMW